MNYIKTKYSNTLNEINDTNEENTKKLEVIEESSNEKSTKTLEVINKSSNNPTLANPKHIFNQRKEYHTLNKINYGQKSRL